MGCSASRLSSTRSGTVSSRFLLPMACLALPAPVPPLALPGRKQRIAGLRHGRGKYVLAADIDPLSGQDAELAIHPGRVLPRQLFHAANAELFEVAQHGRTHRDQVLEITFLHAIPPG